MRVLIIEDNERYRNKLIGDLQSLNYEVVAPVTFTGLAGYDYTTFQLVILDVGLPQIDGRNLIKVIKRGSSAAVIMLTSSSSGEIEYESLKLGADDYIVKPHYLPVLELKIDSLINNQLKQLEICGHYVNPQNLKVDERIKLTAKEYKILVAIYKHQDHLVSKDQLLRDLWESDYFVEEGALYTLIYRLRKKLDDTNIVIKNTRGGYKVDEKIHS